MVSPSLAHRECSTCTVAVDQPSNWTISDAELPSVARISTHWMRWYCEWQLACLSRSAKRATVALSPVIKLFIHDYLKFVSEGFI